MGVKFNTFVQFNGFVEIIVGEIIVKSPFRQWSGGRGEQEAMV